jgi:hypothetical protein
MFRSSDMNDLVPAYTPAVIMSVCSKYTDGAADRVTVWLEPISVFGSSDFDGASGSSLSLDLSLSLTPEPPDAGRPSGSLAATAALIERGYIVSAASDPTVTSHACADRLLQTELQVRFMEVSLLSPS